jgi:peptide/nickel transport system permease protein
MSQTAIADTVLDPVPEPEAEPVAGREFLARFRSDKAAVAGLVVLLIIILAAVLAPLLTKFDPTDQDILGRLKGPSGEHWLGTDDLGRDVFSRLLHGSQVSLLAGPLAAGIGIVVGAPLGIIAGYRGRTWDAVSSRFADALMSLPTLILAVAAIAVLGKGVWNAMIAIGIVLAPRFYRIMRASAQRVAREPYIEASRSIGCSEFRIVITHVVPAVIGTLIVQTTLVLGLAMLGEVALSFLGLGVQPPQSSWGAMMATGYQFIRSDPLLIIIPGAATFVTVLAINYLGEGIRQAIGAERGRGR